MADLLPIFEETDLALFFSEDNQDNYEAFMTTLSDVFEISQNSKVIEPLVRVYNNLEKISTVQREVLVRINKCYKLITFSIENNQETLSIFIERFPRQL